MNRIDRADRRRRGKSDPLDAQNAARAVLSGRARARAKAGDGPVQIARMYKLTKASAVKARTPAINEPAPGCERARHGGQDAGHIDSPLRLAHPRHLRRILTASAQAR